MRQTFLVMFTVVLLSWAAAEPALGQGTTQQGPVTVLTVPHTAAPVTIDFVNAQALGLPAAPSQTDAVALQELIGALVYPPFLGQPGFSSGGNGTGIPNPVALGTPRATEGFRAFGTSNQPFSTARADLSPTATNTSYPYRAAGKLFFKIGTSTFVCSASLIKRGVVVTAAHCVANFGKKQF
jgi:V8-like Glu-specific endopeptidase